MNIEKLVIGSILSEPESASLACELVSSEMFTGKEKDIFAKIEDLTEKGIAPEIFVLFNHLKDKLAIDGGASYLMEMAGLTSSASRLQEYCLILKQEHLGRLLNTFFLQGAAMCEDKYEIQKIMEFAQSGMEQALNLTISANEGFLHISELTEKAILKAEKRALDLKEGKTAGITSGLRPLDRLLNGGFKPSTLNVIAARPAMGKTAVMLHIAKCAAASGVPVCIYSLEMSAVSLTDRMLLSIGNLDIDAYKNGSFTQWAELTQAQGVLDKLPIYIDANPKVSLPYIQNHSRIMRQRGKCGIILIDYLQLADMTTGEKNRNREQEVAQATRKCKLLSKELDLPVVLLSQLSRATETRADKRPQLSDLRESGAIEQDADVVAFLYRADYYGIPDITLYDGSVSSSKGVGEIIIAKHREGAVGDIAFKHNDSMTQIYNF